MQESHRGLSCYAMTDIRQNSGNTHSLRQLQFIPREVKDLSLSLMQTEVGQERGAWKTQSSPPLQSKGFVAQRQENIGHPRKELCTQREAGLGAAGGRALSHLHKAPSSIPSTIKREKSLLQPRQQYCYRRMSSPGWCPHSR